MAMMRNFVLICTLAALSAAEASTSSSSSSSSSSFESAGRICLNGGSSVPSLTSGEHMFCLCAEGFEGRHCEKVKAGQCFEGVGLYYRGTVAKSKSGRTCEEWDSDTRELYLSIDLKSGRHNYCRNLHYKRRPWCFVWKNLQLVWEYCAVPRCSSDSFPDPPPPAPTEPEPGKPPPLLHSLNHPP
ncbi:plasminogen activator, urokinase b, partial [Notothenia coriiceps]|uniref:Plasminogen activator, urokinase b n=1 Tax=Notothenia coriiceps TaxID=8208 RepID=A0A6I9NSE4_9TELE